MWMRSVLLTKYIAHSDKSTARSLRAIRKKCPGNEHFKSVGNQGFPIFVGPWYCFNVYVVTIYYNFSLKIISLKHIKNGCVILRKKIKLKLSSKDLSSLICICAQAIVYKDGWNVTCLWFKRQLKMF